MAGAMQPKPNKGLGVVKNVVEPGLACAHLHDAVLWAVECVQCLNHIAVGCHDDPLGLQGAGQGEEGMHEQR